MKNKISIFLIVISSILFSDSFEVNSPDKNLKFKITNNNGSIVYSIHKDNETIINSSSLGFMFANKPDFTKTYLYQIAQLHHFPKPGSSLGVKTDMCLTIIMNLL